MTEKSPWDGGPNWTHLKNRLPPERVLLETISPGGIQQDLIYHSGHFWAPEGDIYVYYEPQFWRVKNG